MRIFCLAMLAATVVALLPLSSALAQRSYALPRSAPMIRGSLAAGGRVWTVGNPEMVVASGVTHVLPSPDFKHLLIARQTRLLTTNTTAKSEDKNAPSAVTLTWWNVQTHRSREIWRRPVLPGESVDLWMNGWLGKTGSAALRIADGDGIRLLYVNPVAGQTKEIALPPKTDSFPNPSPTQPFAALGGADGGCRDAVRFVDRNGAVGEPIALSGYVFFIRWSPDGTQLYGAGSVTGSDGKRREQWYAVNPARRTVMPIPAPEKVADGGDEYENFGDPADNLPLRLIPDRSSKALHIETVPPTKSRVTVSLDGDPLFLLPDGSGVFFRRDGALYFAPIVSADAPPAGIAAPAP